MQEKKKEDAFEAGDAGQKSGGKGTKFKKADTEGSNVDLVSVTKNVVIPSLWRRGFAPLGEEEMQALERDKGTEALQEYLDIRYDVVAYAPPEGTARESPFMCSHSCK